LTGAGGPRTRARRRLARLALLLALGLGALELGSALVLRARPFLFGGLALGPEERGARLAACIRRTLENRPDALGVLDAELGWKPRANLKNGVDDVDARGLRSLREYADEPAPGILRVAVFGDSFVYGSEVATAEAWPSVLERSSEKLEVLNYGVPGYGEDQIYLRFLAEGQSLRPRIVLLGVAPPTIDRMLAQFEIFRTFEADTRMVSSKPRFRLGRSDELELVPNPIRKPSDLERFAADPSAVRELGRFDHWYEPLVWESPWFDRSHACRLLFSGWIQLRRRYFDPDRPLDGRPGHAVFNASSEGFRILERLVREFDRKAKERGEIPAILVLPDGYAIERRRRGETDLLEPLRRSCREAGLDMLDAAEAFLALPKERKMEPLFLNKFHYSAEGNRVVAEWVGREISH
jgi:hypothetical protein